jgi:hypothetical protein
MFIEFCPEAGWATEDLIRVYGGTREEFRAFCGVLRGMASGGVQEVELHALPGFEPLGGLRVTARLGAASAGVRRVEGLSCFEVVLDEQGWEVAADRADAVSQHLGVSAFNWLTDVGEVSLLLSVSGSW